MDSASEQETMLEAIKTALEMESDGQQCYLAASMSSTNEAGRNLLRSLAEEEGCHRRKFEELYDSISKGRGWHQIHSEPGNVQSIRDTVIETCQKLGISASITKNELEATQVAIDKEKSSYDFYEKQAINAVYAAEKSFYTLLAREEREHELTLLDYYEYLSDPAGWFLEVERQSLDGG